MSSDSSSEPSARNSFTQGSLAALFAKNALPIIFVMSMNGLLSVMDAIFLGIYVGADALAAVTLMFPVYMLVVALSTLVSSGMSSQLARHLGAGQMDRARRLFSGSHGLALLISALLIVSFILLGNRIALLAAGGDDRLGAMGLVYLRINIMATPLAFILGLQADALRNEGRAPLMAAMSLLVSLANMLFNYILIARLDMGVAGSAYGTVAAQGLALTIVLGYRHWGASPLSARDIIRHSPFCDWPDILKLGAPQSLSFIGMSIVSTATIVAIQWMASPDYAVTISAFGISTRIMTFYFLPLLGLSFAMQSITGNNFGARQWKRSDSSLRIALSLALLYCLATEIIFVFFAKPIGALFIQDQAVIKEVGRIMPLTTLMIVSTGPVLIIAAYFQAIGDAKRAALLSLSKSYIFMLPLLFAMPLVLGEQGIWLATPAAELMLLATTTIVLMRTAQQKNRRWGLFTAPGETDQ
nr:MATE family efflux transporter [uncultured Cohaesibacter sp.]